MLKKITLLMLTLMLFSSCCSQSYAVGGGYHYINGGRCYSEVTLPLEVGRAINDKDSAIVPISNTSVDLSNLKKGVGETINILRCVEWGNAGVNKAAKEANITKINYIDVNEKTVFFLFRRITTTVYGE